MDSDFPLVCICVPTYNAAATVRETLESILAQTYLNLVVHVSDNASNDETLQVIELIEDSRIHIHRNEVNVGGEGNFTRCIQLAEGKYTAIFHADDVYEPDMVAKQVAFLEANPQAGAVFTEATTIDDKSNVIGEINLPKSIASSDGLYDFTTMLKAVLRHSNFFICPSVMVRTEVYQQEIRDWRGGLFKSSADLDLWLSILQHHPVGYLQERLMRYRISDNQFSARVRMGTERADFFLVMDYYLSQQSVIAFLDSVDFRNYMRLDSRDCLMRAVNLFIIGKIGQSKELLDGILSRDLFLAAIQNKRGLFVLLVSMYLKLLLTLRLEKIGKSSLLYFKRIARK